MTKVQFTDVVGFDQGIGRAFYPAGKAQCIQYASYQSGFACTKIAIKINDHARFEALGNSPCKHECRVFVGKTRADSAIIVAMQKSVPLQIDYQNLAARIRIWAQELGFQMMGITDTDLTAAETGLLEWLALGRHGDMDYMAIHGFKRSRPAELVPGTLRVISVGMNYFPPHAHDSWQVLADGERAYISRYATGRDYHKVLRARLARLAEKIRDEVAGFEGRVFTDSAPVMEVELAFKAGLGWRGKHTLLLSREYGSYFFLGEVYVNLPLPVDGRQQDHCGTCTQCMDACPTRAIVAPYRLDARRCISYLTIEHKGSIPVELRTLIGNRIYGCDDCQLVCPWNRFAQLATEPDFNIRFNLDRISLAELFGWDEITFRQKFAGSAIYRIGYERWLRNIAVALGNAPRSEEIINVLSKRAEYPSEIVREHVAWAIQQQANR